jgi:hypothetical protein
VDDTLGVPSVLPDGKSRFHTLKNSLTCVLTKWYSIIFCFPRSHSTYPLKTFPPTRCIY